MTSNTTGNISGLRVKACFDSSFQAADLESWCESYSEEWGCLQIKVDLKRSYTPSVREALGILDTHFGEKLSLHLNFHDPRRPEWIDENDLYDSVLPTSKRIVHFSTAIAGDGLALTGGRWLVENSAGDGSNPASLSLLRDFISDFSDPNRISACIDYGHLMKCDDAQRLERRKAIEEWAESGQVGLISDVHLHDCTPDADHLLPGEGSVDFAELLTWLKLLRLETAIWEISLEDPIKGAQSFKRKLVRLGLLL